MRRLVSPQIVQRVTRHGPAFAVLLLGGALGAVAVWLGDTGAREVPSSVRDLQPDARADDVPSVWTCSMHPQIAKAEAGQCPICAMDLIPRGSPEGGARYDGPGVVLSERAQEIAGVRVAPVRRQADASAEVRLLGRVEPDEASLKVVPAWTGGRIDRLHVNVTGEQIQADQVVATLFSPEVFSAHQDLLTAKQQVNQLEQGPQAVREAAAAALDAARERVRLLGLSDAELAQMESQEAPTRAVDIRAPAGGTVIERVATEGAYVAVGSPLYHIADLSSVWIQLDAYESDLPRLDLGDRVKVHVEALPDQEFEGRVAFIDPAVDAVRRTANVRVGVSNADFRLRPGMFAEAVVMAEAEDGERTPLVIPTTAALFTGGRSVVYVARELDGRTAYEPRTVRLGPRLAEVYPVVAGLAEGEQVVVRGAFVLDAELQIRGGAGMMAVADDSMQGPSDRAIELPQAQRDALAPVVAAYLAVQRALAADDLARARQQAKALRAHVERTRLTRPRSAAAVWPPMAEALQGHAHRLQQAQALQSARAAFGGLSQVVTTLLRRFGNPLAAPLHLAFCPMAMGSQGASWIQQGREVDNAYFGASMRSCGEVRQELAPGAYLRPPEESAAGRPPPGARPSEAPNAPMERHP